LSRGQAHCNIAKLPRRASSAPGIAVAPDADPLPSERQSWRAAAAAQVAGNARARPGRTRGVRSGGERGDDQEEEAEGGKEDGTRNAPPAAALFSRGGAGRAS
ncbi:unnamed protein product, partial [Prorocentrum cordatum]